MARLNGLAPKAPAAVAFKAIADDTALTVADGLGYFTVPERFDGWHLSRVDVHVYTASTSGLPSFQIYNLTQTHDMLTTNVTIDANETDSGTATTPAVITVANRTVNGRDVLRTDCDAAGTGTKGYEVTLEFEEI